MDIKKYADKVLFMEYDKIKNELIKNIVFLLKKYKTDSIYITKNSYPIYIFEASDLLTIYSQNEFNIKMGEFILEHPKKIEIFDINTNIIDAYHYMRSNDLKKVAIIENKKLIGEVAFKIISAKMVDIVIKDRLTGVYNASYFNILVEEYKDFNKPIGIIYIDVSKMTIIEGLYGREKLNKILIEIAHKLETLVRDIDFIFRIDYRFKIITFANLEITEKIANRIKKALNEMEVEGIKINYNLVFSNVPGLESNILLALDNLKRNIMN